jgi:hypothetical protein
MNSEIVDGLVLNSSNQMQSIDLNNNCIRDEAGFQIVEFTYECFVLKLNEFKFVLQMLVFLVLISLDILANLIVISSIIIEKNKKRVDICFMSNAIADLVMGSVVMPLTAVYTLFGHFPLDNISCLIWNCADFTTGTVSI